MLVKMVGLQKIYNDAVGAQDETRKKTSAEMEESGIRPLRQLLITASPRLCMALRSYYDKLMAASLESKVRSSIVVESECLGVLAR